MNFTDRFDNRPTIRMPLRDQRGAGGVRATPVGQRDTACEPTSAQIITDRHG